MKKLTYEQIKSFTEGEEGNGCKLLTTEENFKKEYKGNQTKLLFKCSCGNEFEKSYLKFKNHKQRQCKECGRRNGSNKKKTSVIVNCAYCGKELEMPPNRIKAAKNIFCNAQCKGKYMSEHLKGENNPNFKAVTVQCEYCGKDIIKHPSWVKEHNFCSQECLANSRKTGETVKCYVCGKEFYKIKSQIDRSEKHFCSEKCKCEHQTTLRGELSPQYNPNLTDEERIVNRDCIEYTEWRNKVFERDNYTCQRCGKRQGDINAHHLNGYHWYKEGRTDVNNGVTLCSCCHKEFHEIYSNRNNTKEQYEEWTNK
jgi:endogenous inhibitor of DNA gyrase (YacG/DUF329 family)